MKILSDALLDCLCVHARNADKTEENRNPYLHSEQIRLLFPALNQGYFSTQQSNTNKP
jgi:hypothetical protein